MKNLLIIILFVSLVFAAEIDYTDKVNFLKQKIN